MVMVCLASPPVLVKLPETVVIEIPPESCLAPTTNLSLKSGVPLVPSQSCQPVGMEATVPDQIRIEPMGRELFWLPGAGTVLPTITPDMELVGRSLATKLVHSCGTVVETVKALVFDEIV